MIPSLQRITTEYLQHEDRIRLAGEVEQAAPVAIWFTQRLLGRLLPRLMQWLEHSGPEIPRSELLHSFAQQAARSELTPQSAVQVSAQDPSWLVVVVDLTLSEELAQLVFKGEQPDQQVSLTLAAVPLRQWLNIVHDAYVRAEWPLDLWPLWVRESAEPQRTRPALLH